MFTLLVIDMQSGLFTPANPRHDAAGVVLRINALIKAARERGGSVVFVRHNGKPEDDLVPGTPGWEILPDLHRRESDPVVEKAACDAFCRTNLDELLRERRTATLIICGCCSDFCVDTTLRAAVSRDYEVVAVSDAHTTADRPHLDAAEVIRHHNWVWEQLISPGKPVRVLPTEEVLALLNSGSWASPADR